MGLALSLGWEADLWGRMKAGNLAAIANTQARQAELVAARLSLSAQAVRAWFAAIEARPAGGVGAIFGGELPDIDGAHSGPL